MAEQKYKTWLVGAGIGIGIAFGTVIMQNVGIESRVLRIILGAVAGGVIALVALAIIGAIQKKSS